MIMEMQMGWRFGSFFPLKHMGCKEGRDHFDQHFSGEM